LVDHLDGAARYRIDRRSFGTPVIRLIALGGSFIRQGRHPYHPDPYRAGSGTTASVIALVLVKEARRKCFMAQTLNVPTPEPPAHDPPTDPLHDLRGDPTYEPPPRTDPTPNPASDSPREVPRGVAWC
jgi:hypothetical protein